MAGTELDLGCPDSNLGEAILFYMASLCFMLTALRDGTGVTWSPQTLSTEKLHCVSVLTLLDKGICRREEGRTEGRG